MSCKVYHNFKDLNIYPKPYLYQIEYINFFLSINNYKNKYKKIYEKRNETMIKKAITSGKPSLIEF